MNNGKGFTDYRNMQARQNDIPELFLPGPNEFMPTNLDVEKRDVAEVIIVIPAFDIGN